MSSPYRQFLPELELSIERYTDAVPDDGAWYLMQFGQELGRFRSLKAAQERWKEVVRESDWTPTPIPVDVERARLREQQERWARNRAG